MTALGEDVAGKKDIGTRDFTGVDAAAERQGVVRVGTKIPNGGEAPPRQHLPHMLFERRNRRAGRVFPYRLRKMDVTIPEAGDDSLSSAVNDPRIIRDLDFATTADRGDGAPGRQDDGIYERGGIGRWVYPASHESDLLLIRGDAETSRHAEEKRKRGAEQISDHGRSLELCMSAPRSVEERRASRRTISDQYDLALIVLAPPRRYRVAAIDAVTPCYSSGAFSIGSNLSASRPSRFHDCSICGGSGAVASMNPPRGCGIKIRRANRCSRFCRPPGSCQFSLLKYLGSPTMA